MNVWLLKLHRWIALALALPFVVLLYTGLVLSFEPWIVTRAIKPGALTVERIETLLSKHDEKGQARAINYRPYDQTLTIGAGRGGTNVVVDVVSGEVRPGPSWLAAYLNSTRRLHEHVIQWQWFKDLSAAMGIDDNWLTVVATVGMLVLAVIGMLMGLPRWSNTLSGWHKVTAWGLLPLIVLSPLTGLFIAWGITFQPPRPAPGPGAEKTPQMRLVEAVRIVGKTQDLSGLVWIRPQGGGIAARIVEGGEYRGYRVTRDGAQATPRNWPRLWHEGNFAGGWSALLNVVTSFALIGLLVTGGTMWARTTLRRRRRRMEQAAAAAGAAA